MPHIQTHFNLKRFNTFGLDVSCTYFVEIHSIEDFLELTADPVYKSTKHLVLGGGSNVLFLGDFDGLVIRNCIRGIEVQEENGEEVLVHAGAGEVWHDFVCWCIERGYGGLENLSLIPGCVGASPMQNIGAYGVEIKDCFSRLEALSMFDGSPRTFTAQECRFGYRESVFKHEYKNQYFITRVSFRLSKRPILNTGYGAIAAELKAMKIDAPGIADVSKAIIAIRSSKLPNPKVLGNAGSFFKNPEVSADTYQSLIKQHPDLVAYPLENNRYKLAAGWLIERCGLKGFEKNGAAVHDKQALVLVNKDNASGKAIYALSEHVVQAVHKSFGVWLEREVNVVG